MSDILKQSIWASEPQQAPHGSPAAIPDACTPACETFRYHGWTVCMEDIPEELRDIAELLGLEVLFQLLELRGGATTYFPEMKSLFVKDRDREIRRLFTGGNYKQLAKQFRLSERHIRKIISGRRS